MHAYVRGHVCISMDALDADVTLNYSHVFGTTHASSKLVLLCSPHFVGQYGEALLAVHQARKGARACMRAYVCVYVRVCAYMCVYVRARVCVCSCTGAQLPQMQPPSIPPWPLHSQRSNLMFLRVFSESSTQSPFR